MGNREWGKHRIRGLLALACLMLLCVVASVDRASAQVPDEPALPDSRFPIPDSPPAVSLLTVGPGEIFFERFGHNAIVVRDEATGEALAYNYGLFDFEQEAFLLNFARGRMRYLVAADALADDLAMYRAEGRSIVEQRLDLTPEQARALADFLAWNVRPENAYYRYDYFLANCSTRVRDALDQALGGALKAQSEGRSRGYTWRLDALRLMAPEPWLMLLIDLGLGPFADQRIDYWQESFVPMTLQHVVGEARLAGGAPLVASTDLVAANRVAEPPALPPDLRVPFLLLGLALGALLVWAGRRRDRAPRVALASFAVLFELACGIGGWLLLFLWFGTDHRAAWRNENLLLLNPLCLALVPAWFGYARGAARRRAFATALAWLVVLLAAFALFSKILPWFVQANLAWIVLLLPIHLALALTLQQSKPPSGG